MAKKEKMTLNEARKKLQDANQAYQKLIKKPTGTFTEDQKRKHTQACRRALAEKRYARAVIEALSQGRAAPEPKDLHESQILIEG